MLGDPIKIKLDLFISEAKTLISNAQTLADENQHEKVEPLHLLAITLKSTEALEYWKGLPIDLDELQAQTTLQLSKLSQTDKESYLSSEFLDLLKRAERNIKRTGTDKAGIQHILNALTEEKGNATASLFATFKIAPNCFKDGKIAPLPNCLISLSSKAKSGKLETMIGRDGELRRLIQILGRHYKHHPMIVGQAGVGKRTLVNALASKMASNQVPSPLGTFQVLQLDIQNLLSGVKLRGEVSDRMKKALSAIKNQNTIIYIPFFESIFGQQNLMNGMSDVVMSLVLSSNLRVIASTTPDALNKLSDKESNLLNRFTQISLDPLSALQTIEVLRGVAPRYENHHKVQIGDPAITSAVRLAKRYLQNRALPESAIDLLDESASRKRMEIDGLTPELDAAMHRLASIKAQMFGLAGDEDPTSVKTKKGFELESEKLEKEVADRISAMDLLKKESNGEVDCVLGEESIASVLGDWTGIPVSKMLESDADRFVNMEERLGKGIVGQQEALTAVSRSVKRSQAGLRDPKKPIGSFLFLGPSGVGKTLLAKKLAGFLFDDEDAMLRIDCSELGEKHSVSRLLGSPNGYTDSESGGQLTSFVGRKPYSVLLFDEVEKGHADIFNILLQVLDDGRLTDGRGRTFDFSNTIVIMTSNIGSKDILETPVEVFANKEGCEKLKLMLRDQLTKHLRPEFINRVDEIIIFQPISKDTLRTVADIEIAAVERMMSEKEIKLQLTDQVKWFLVNDKFEPSFGARPLKRSIAKFIQDPLSERLLAGKYKNGATINISMSDNNIQFN